MCPIWDAATAAWLMVLQRSLSPAAAAVRRTGESAWICISTECMYLL